MVQLHEHDLLPVAFHEFPIFNNHRYRTRQDHGLCVRVAVDALVNDAANIWLTQMRVTLALRIIRIANVVVVVVFFGVGKPIQHAREVINVAKLFFGANQIFLVFVYPNAGRRVVRLDGDGPGLHAALRDELFNFGRDGDELLTKFRLER